jgi:hypothetical protein
MINVIYCLAGVWHRVTFTRAAPAVAFFRVVQSMVPRHVSSVAMSEV